MLACRAAGGQDHPPPRRARCFPPLPPQPGATPGDTAVNVTLQFVDACNKDKKTPLTIQALVRQCAAAAAGGPPQNPLLQPWQSDSVKIEVVPAVPSNFTCPAGMSPIPFDAEEQDFTPMWRVLGCFFVGLPTCACYLHHPQRCFLQGRRGCRRSQQRAPNACPANSPHASTSSPPQGV